MIDILLVILFSYLCGSIPFGLILTKVFKGKDIRKIGSGNIGATNVLRTGNKFLAALTLFFDALKGYAPVLITKYFFPEQMQIAALMTFIGHIFPVWLKFNGGKGVATYLGILLGISIPSSILFIFTWVIVLLIFKYASVSSIFSSLTVLVINILKDNAIKAINPDFILIYDIKFLLFIFFILIMFTHRKNIYNLKNKRENKIKI